MTPATPEQQDSALAALTGTITERKAGSDLERAMLRLRLVAEAQQRGVSWAMIGAAMGCGPKEAKRYMKQLARETQRQLTLSKNRERPRAAPFVHEFTLPATEEEMAAVPGPGFTLETTAGE